MYFLTTLLSGGFLAVAAYFGYDYYVKKNLTADQIEAWKGYKQANSTNIGGIDYPRIRDISIKPFVQDANINLEENRKLVKETKVSNKIKGKSFAKPKVSKDHPKPTPSAVKADKSVASNDVDFINSIERDA